MLAKIGSENGKYMVEFQADARVGFGKCIHFFGVGTRLRTGEVNPLFGFDGGGQQYDLIINGKNVGTFTNERIIGQ